MLVDKVPNRLVTQNGVKIRLLLRSFSHATTIPCRIPEASGRARLRDGKPITPADVELGVSAATIHNWVRQDQIDRGERPGITTPERIELAKAKKRIRLLEQEAEVMRRAVAYLARDVNPE